MQMGLYFDQERCTNCRACVIACKDWHDIQDPAVNRLMVENVVLGKYPDVFVAFLAFSCGHCAQPACAEACPAGVISKRETDGVMVVDTDGCLGEQECGLCKTACPYQSPQFGSEHNAKMQMCTFCPDRLAEGKNPVCVDACPVYALDAGPLDALIEKHGDHREAVGFAFSEKVGPSIRFRPKKIPSNLASAVHSGAAISSIAQRAGGHGIGN